MTRCYTQIESPLGSLLLAADEVGLREILFVNGRHPARPEPSWKEDRAPCTARPSASCKPISPENSKASISNSLPRAPPFNWECGARLCEIPYGETISYGELASRIGNPKASRAVGLANGSNPIPIVIPCHRVIGSNGKLTGYGGGLPIKEKLLALERRQLCLL